MALGKTLGGGAAALTVKDEGSTLSTAVTSIDFVGAGVTATNVGGAVTATITAGGTPAEVRITETLLGAAAATFSFSSIAGIYRDLRLVVRARSNNGAANFSTLLIQFNSDTAANYRWQRGQSHSLTTHEAEGSASATSINIGWVPATSGPASTFGSADVRILNYAGTTFFKNVLYLANSPAAGVYLAGHGSGWYASSSAITGITVLQSAGSFITDSVATLYGII